MSIRMLEVSSPLTEVVDGFAQKECSRCQTPKPLYLFQRDRSKQDGRMNVCATCVREKQRRREEIRFAPADLPFNFHAR